MLNVRNQLVHVKREDIIKALTEGLDSHKLEYTEAMEDYKIAVVKFLENALHNANSGTFKDLVLNISAPTNHERDYQNVLDMLEYSVDETFQLDSDTFRAYFKGEWSWKNSFMHTMLSTKEYISN